VRKDKKLEEDEVGRLGSIWEKKDQTEKIKLISVYPGYKNGKGKRGRR